MAGTVTMGQRAISVSPQSTQGTAAATYNWQPKATAAQVRPVTEIDTPDLLTYTRATQREADPGTIHMVAEISGLVDAYFGFLLCGVAGQPTAGTWTIGKDDPDLLTFTMVEGGLTTAAQMVDGLVTSLVVHVPPRGPLTYEARAVGVYTEPIATPSPTIPASVVFQATQCILSRNGTGVKTLGANLTITQDGDPLYTTPTSVGGSAIPFAQADEIESFGVTARYDVLQKYTAYSGSSIYAATHGTSEAWIWTATRPDVSAGTAHSFILTIPKYYPADPNPDNKRPRLRQATAGPVILDTGIAGLATVAIAGTGAPSYAKS